MNEEEIIRLLKEKIDCYSKIKQENYDDYYDITLDEGKATKCEEKQLLQELHDSNIFVNGRIEAFQYLIKEIQDKKKEV